MKTIKAWAVLTPRGRFTDVYYTKELAEIRAGEMYKPGSVVKVEIREAK